METYFQVRYEFDRDAVHQSIADTLSQGRSAYICVADGNVLTHVHHDERYRHTVQGALFSICDSSWVPLYLKWLYGIERVQYCGAQIFSDIVRAGQYRMAFLGADAATLDDLRRVLTGWNPAVAEMPFIALPYGAVEDFDYSAIAEQLHAAGAEIVWVALGAPKQDVFMQALVPHLRRGVAIGVGAVFNMYSGRIRRAPAWVQVCHLEFIYRIFREPTKQVARCWKIITTLPALFLAEKKRGTQQTQTEP